MTKARNDVRWLFSDFNSGTPKKKAQNFATLSGSSGLGDLAYSRTFSEGLCSLAGPDSPTVSEETVSPSSSSSSLRNLFNALETGKKWLDSLKIDRHTVREEETTSLKSFSHSLMADDQTSESSATSVSLIKPQTIHSQDDPFLEGESERDDGCTFNWHLNRSGQNPLITKKPRRTSSASSLASSVRRSLLCNTMHKDTSTFDDSEALLSGSITIAGGLCLFAQEELSLTKFLSQNQNFPLHNDAVELAFS